MKGALRLEDKQGGGPRQKAEERPRAISLSTIVLDSVAQASALRPLRLGLLAGFLLIVGDGIVPSKIRAASAATPPAKE